jgi:hypothetical protein
MGSRGQPAQAARHRLTHVSAALGGSRTGEAARAARDMRDLRMDARPPPPRSSACVASPPTSTASPDEAAGRWASQVPHVQDLQLPAAQPCVRRAEGAGTLPCAGQGRPRLPRLRTQRTARARHQILGQAAAAPGREPQLHAASPGSVVLRPRGPLTTALGSSHARPGGLSRAGVTVDPTRSGRRI